MREVTTYRHQIASSEPFQLIVGDYAFQIELIWPETVQEQWDDLQRQLLGSSRSDPIIREGVRYDRTYNYIDYYDSVPAFGSGMEEWWAEQTEYPQSLKDKEDSVVYTVLSQRKELVAQLKVFQEELKEQLLWHVKITAGSEVTAGVVRTGGWIRNQDNTWSMRFLADVEEIGRDQLPVVTIEVETYEFV